MAGLKINRRHKWYLDRPPALYRFCAPAIVPYSNLMRLPRPPLQDYFDGVGLFSIPHPVRNIVTPLDLSEASLVRMWFELRGFDMYGTSCAEFIRCPAPPVKEEPGPW